MTLTATLSASPAAAAPRTIVVPVAQTTTAGKFNNIFPFGCIGVGPSMRYQQVYAGTEVGRRVIKRMAFRPGAEFAPPFGPTVISDVTITLSATTAPVDGLSTTFADNVGRDAKTVFRGDLTLSSRATGGPPRDFDVVIPMQRSFNFKPRKVRNLLLDVSIPACVETSGLDYEETEGDSVSRLYTTDSTSPEGSPDTGGLVTEFR